MGRQYADKRRDRRLPLPPRILDALPRWAEDLTRALEAEGEAFTPAARAYLTTGAQSIPNNTITTVTFDAARVNQSGMWSSNTPTQLIARQSGIYVLAASVEFAADSVGVRRLSIVSGGIIASLNLPPAGTGITRLATATIWYMSEGSTVVMQVLQTSGGALNINATANHSPELSAIRIGPRQESDA